MKKKILSLFCIAAFGASMLSVLPAIAYDTADGVVINEVCTGNDGENSNLTDVVDSKGKYCDWIELYNPQDYEVDLTGLYITDDDTDLTQAQIPGGTKIAANGYLVIYCGKNIVESDYPDIVAAKFGLSASGETLILSDGTNAIDTFVVPEIATDMTYSRVPSGGEDMYVTYPTPNAANTEDDIPKEPDAPTFSRDSGAFTDSFELTISAAEGTKIYYTTDGSTPTVDSTEYTGAITVVDRTSEPNVLAAMDKSLFTDRYGTGAPTVTVDKATVIRAIAVKDDMVSSTATATYFVGITNETYSDVAIISIVTDYDNLFDPDTGIYMLDNVYNKGKEWERPVHIDFIEDNTAVLSQDCGMRIQGGYSRTDYQKSLRFYARSEYGSDTFDYPLIPGLTSRDGEGRVIDSFEKFVLRNGGNDANYVKYKDTMLQSMVSDMDVATQAGRPVIAFINGEYWGIYTLQEDYTDDYVKSNYDVKKKNVVMIKPDSLNNNTPKVEEGEDEDLDLWTDTVNWMYSCDLTDESQYEVFKSMFDVESLADYFAIETYITNEDWSGKNWCVWRSREADENNPDYADCKWRFMLYDTEMGAYLWGNSGESSQNNKVIQIYEAGKNYNDPIAVIFYKALQNSEFKSLFNESMNEVAEKYDSEVYKSVLEEYNASYYPNLQKYYDRFPTWSSMSSADQCISWMNDFFLGTSSLPARQDYYTTMLRALDLFQIYERLDTSTIDSDDLSTINSAYSKALRYATTTGSKYATQTKYLDALEEALMKAGVIEGDADLSITVDVSGIDIDEEISVTIADSATAEEVQTLTASENEAIEASLPEGEYTVTFSNSVCVTRTYTLSVTSGENSLDAVIHLIGDVNGDGKVTTADVGLSNSHAKGVKILEDYEFDCTDVNSDGNVTTADVGKINSHAKGVSLLFSLA
ncbi:MAG: CotH kinase family protein [Ruminococcus sp.]|nr:CotH kinase family protein [Ruminococcus sp.]